MVFPVDEWAVIPPRHWVRVCIMYGEDVATSHLFGEGRERNTRVGIRKGNFFVFFFFLFLFLFLFLFFFFFPTK